ELILQVVTAVDTEVYGVHPRGARGVDVPLRVVDEYALGRRQPETLGGERVDPRLRLRDADFRRHDHVIEEIPDARVAEALRQRQIGVAQHGHAIPPAQPPDQLDVLDDEV